MRVGLSVDPPLATIPGVLAEEGVDTYQTVLRDPGRFGNFGVPDPTDRAALIEGLRGRNTGAGRTGPLPFKPPSREGGSRTWPALHLLSGWTVAAGWGAAGVSFTFGGGEG